MGQLSFQSDHKVTMTEVYDFGILGTTINDDQALSRTTNLGIQAAMGVIPSVDLHLRNNGDSPLMFISKWQFIGNHLNAAENGFKMAIWGGVGSMEEDEGSLIVENETQKKTFNGKIKVTPWELGLSFGHRFAPRALVYSNALYAKYPSTSTLTQSNEVKTIKGDALLESVILGLRFGDHRLACHVEIAASRLRWKGDQTLQQEIGTMGFGVQLGF